MAINIEQLINPQNSDSGLIRFEDATDENVPTLSYSVPLPGSFEGKHIIETDLNNEHIPWTDDAKTGANRLELLKAYLAASYSDPEVTPPRAEDIAIFPTILSNSNRSHSNSTNLGRDARRFRPNVRFGVSSILNERIDSETENESAGSPDSNEDSTDVVLMFNDEHVSLKELAQAADSNLVPMFYHTFGGTLKMDFVYEAQAEEDLNPRFIIIEHYRQTNFFEDYGAGKTIGVFSLMPGEETTLYIRDWRRSEQKIKEASSIFDSFTEEAADEYEEDFQRENARSLSRNGTITINRRIKAKAEVAYKGARVKASGSVEGERTNNLTASAARESLSKSVAKNNKKHASKASSKRDTEITQELEKKEEQEFERITERKIKNTNLSRTLNIVTRELNQEFVNYLSLVDVKLAFVNDKNKIDVFEIHEIDDMLNTYIQDAPDSTGTIVDGSGSRPFGNVSAKTFVRSQLLNQINEIYDFRGTRHEFLEAVSHVDGEDVVASISEEHELANPYFRVRRNRVADGSNPFYEEGDVPVEGIVLEQNKYTIKTSAVIIDSLLGHGVALDNYALGMQQETLREKQLENRKTELAIELIVGDNAERLDAYRTLFGSVDQELLQRIVES